MNVNAVAGAGAAQHEEQGRQQLESQAASSASAKEGQVEQAAEAVVGRTRSGGSSSTVKDVLGTSPNSFFIGVVEKAAAAAVDAAEAESASTAAAFERWPSVARAAAALASESESPGLRLRSKLAAVGEEEEEEQEEFKSTPERKRLALSPEKDEEEEEAGGNPFELGRNPFELGGSPAEVGGKPFEEVVVPNPFEIGAELEQEEASSGAAGSTCLAILPVGGSIPRTRIDAISPPVRLRMSSADKLCARAMIVEWEDGSEARQRWCSSDDLQNGWYETEKLLPPTATNISLQFKVKGLKNGWPIHAVDRHNGCAWVMLSKKRYSPEIICFRVGAGHFAEPIDALFQMKGSVQACHVRRAWNTARPEEVEPQEWECWDDQNTRPPYEGSPATLLAANAAAPPQAAAAACSTPARSSGSGAASSPCSSREAEHGSVSKNSGQSPELIPALDESLLWKLAGRLDGLERTVAKASEAPEQLREVFAELNECKALRMPLELLASQASGRPEGGELIFNVADSLERLGQLEHSVRAWQGTFLNLDGDDGTSPGGRSSRAEDDFSPTPRSNRSSYSFFPKPAFPSMASQAMKSAGATMAKAKDNAKAAFRLPLSRRETSECLLDPDEELSDEDSPFSIALSLEDERETDSPERFLADVSEEDMQSSKGRSPKKMVTEPIPPAAEPFEITLNVGRKHSFTDFVLDDADGATLHVNSLAAADASPVEAYNRSAAPGQHLQVGDYILQANGQKVNLQAFNSTVGGAVLAITPLRLTVRRPILFRRTVEKGSASLGLQLKYGPQSRSFLIEEVNEGPVRESCPDIRAGDRIVAVNGKEGFAEWLVLEIRESDVVVLLVSRAAV